MSALAEPCAGITGALALPKALFEQLEANNIAHCHWKSNVRLGESLSGLTDIDLLVDRKHSTACEKLLLDLGFKRFESPSFGRYPAVEDWLGCDGVAGALVHVQLHYRLVSGYKFIKEQGLPWTEQVLSSTVLDSVTGVRTPCPEVELLLLYARIASKTSLALVLVLGSRAGMPLHVRHEAGNLRAQCDSTRLRRYAGALLPHVNDELMAVLSSLDPLAHRRTALQLLSGLRNSLRPWRTVPSVIAAVRCLGTKAMVRAAMIGRALPGGVQGVQIAKVPASGGLIVAVVGADGAGKSTVVSRLRCWLRWKVEVRSLYLGNDRGFHLAPARWIYRQVRRGRARSASLGNDGPHSRSQHAGNLATALRGLWNAKTRVRRARRAQRLRERGCVVVTDRYPQEQVVGMLDGPSAMSRDGSLCAWLARRERQCYRRMSAWRPDVVIKLAVAPEVAAGRKPDHDPMQIRAKGEALETLQFPGSRVYTVDASLPLESVLVACRRAVWDSI